MAKKQRSANELLASTSRFHVVHDPEQNARIVAACVQQRAVHNRTVEHLLEHRSDEPLHKSAAKGVTGLYGIWPAWRAEGPALDGIPSLVARGAIAAAADQVAKWEATNTEHAIAIAIALERNQPEGLHADGRWRPGWNRPSTLTLVRSFIFGDIRKVSGQTLLQVNDPSLKGGA